MRLYDLPPRPLKPIKLHGSYVEQVGKRTPVTILYHHADGAYSYCTMEMNDEEFGVVHLSMNTPIKKRLGKYHLLDATKELTADELIKGGEQ